MKLTLFLSLFFISFVSCAQDAESPENAVIYVYRLGQYTGVMHNWDIYINGVDYCKLSNKRQIIIPHAPGTLNITAAKGGIDIQAKKVEIFTVKANAGDTIYLKGDVKSSMTRYRMELSRIFPDQYEREGKELEIDNCQQSE